MVGLLAYTPKALCISITKLGCVLECGGHLTILKEFAENLY